MKGRKLIVLIDLDGVVADFDKAFSSLEQTDWKEGDEKIVPEYFFSDLELIEGALESITRLSKYFDIYFLSTPQWSNPNCWREKRVWTERYFGELLFKRLILTHNKGLLRGDYLIDDRTVNGVMEFEGEHIHFGTDKFSNWNKVENYLISKLEIVRKLAHPHYK